MHQVVPAEQNTVTMSLTHINPLCFSSLFSSPFSSLKVSFKSLGSCTPTQTQCASHRPLLSRTKSTSIMATSSCQSTHQPVINGWLAVDRPWATARPQRPPMTNPHRSPAMSSTDRWLSQPPKEDPFHAIAEVHVQAHIQASSTPSQSGDQPSAAATGAGS